MNFESPDLHSLLGGQATAAHSDEARLLLKSQLDALSDRLRELSPTHPAGDRARLLLESARTLLQLDFKSEAWQQAREAFDPLIDAEQWESAVECCNVMYQSEQPQSLAALGQGIWLAVTFPVVSPEVAVVMLEHVVDSTPDDSDGAAVAAATAHYLADLRAQDKERENLLFFTGQLLSRVARRHGTVNDQAAFDAWIKRLELDEPQRFLTRLRNVVDVLVQDAWWVDREAIWARLPVN
jgi:hypothetical protein